MEQIRSFVAIELDSTLQEALAQVQRQLKRAKVAHIGRWVAPESIHLTLKFLGDIGAERVGEIEDAIRRGCGSLSPLHITLSAPGCFPDARRPRVLWIGVGGDVQALTRLQEGVDSELAKLGFPSEKRGFQPHLTLARIRDNARGLEREEMGKWVSTTKVETAVDMLVGEISLMRSDLRPTGAVYTRLAAVPLMGSQ